MPSSTYYASSFFVTACPGGGGGGDAVCADQPEATNNTIFPCSTDVVQLGLSVLTSAYILGLDIRSTAIAVLKASCS